MATDLVTVIGGNWATDATWTDLSKPTAADDATADALSGAFTIDTGAVGRSLDCTGFTGVLTHNASVILVLGDGTAGAGNIALKLVPAMTYTLNSATSSSIDFFSSSGTQQTITTAGKTLGSLRISNFSTVPNYILTDALTCSSISHRGGTFDTGNQTVTTGSFTQGSGTGKTFALGSSTINLTGTGNVWNPNGTIQASNATFILSAASASSRTFIGADSTYKTLTYTVAGSTGTLDITGSNTFETLNFSDITNARTLRFTAATTNNFTLFNVNGTASKLMSVSSITAATHTLNSSVQQSCDYLSLTNSIATGGPWYAGTHSVDNGGNSGWIFTAPPTSSPAWGTNGMQSRKNLLNLQNLR